MTKHVWSISNEVIRKHPRLGVVPHVTLYCETLDLLGVEVPTEEAVEWQEYLNRLETRFNRQKNRATSDLFKASGALKELAQAAIRQRDEATADLTAALDRERAAVEALEKAETMFERIRQTPVYGEQRPMLDAIGVYVNAGIGLEVVTKAIANYRNRQKDQIGVTD